MSVELLRFHSFNDHSCRKSHTLVFGGYLAEVSQNLCVFRYTSCSAQEAGQPLRTGFVLMYGQLLGTGLKHLGTSLGSA